MLSCTSEKSKLPALHRNPMSLAKSTSKLFQKACVREEDMITNMTDNETAPKKAAFLDEKEAVPRLLAKSEGQNRLTNILVRTGR